MGTGSMNLDNHYYKQLTTNSYYHYLFEFSSHLLWCVTDFNITPLHFYYSCLLLPPSPAPPPSQVYSLQFDIFHPICISSNKAVQLFRSPYEGLGIQIASGFRTIISTFTLHHENWNPTQNQELLTSFSGCKWDWNIINIVCKVFSWTLSSAISACCAKEEKYTDAHTQTQRISEVKILVVTIETSE